jgi:hypothetical protein
MRTHTFKVIQWLDNQQEDRFAVVEVDQLGPVLRDGPYRTLKYANHRADVMQGRAERRTEVEKQR